MRCTNRRLCGQSRRRSARARRSQYFEFTCQLRVKLSHQHGHSSCSDHCLSRRPGELLKAIQSAGLANFIEFSTGDFLLVVLLDGKFVNLIEFYHRLRIEFLSPGGLITDNRKSFLRPRFKSFQPAIKFRIVVTDSCLYATVLVGCTSLEDEIHQILCGNGWLFWRRFVGMSGHVVVRDC